MISTRRNANEVCIIVSGRNISFRSTGFERGEQLLLRSSLGANELLLPLDTSVWVVSRAVQKFVVKSDVQSTDTLIRSQKSGSALTLSCSLRAGYPVETLFIFHYCDFSATTNT